MKQRTPACRLFSLALLVAFALSAAAPLVRCAHAAAGAGHASNHGQAPAPEAPCAAPCCALRAPDGDGNASTAAPLADRRLAPSDALKKLVLPVQPGPALAPFASHALPAAPAPPPAAVADAAHGPPDALPVRLHVFHAAFLN